jgi:cyclopropane fatty-acyl-phospholipid synthase-like methyltransferase
MKILDLGCGMGLSAFYLAQEYGADVFATDDCQSHKEMRLCEVDNRIYEYNAVIQSADDSGGAYVAFPYDVRAEFGKGRVKCV